MTEAPVPAPADVPDPALAAVQRAALERALLDGDAALGSDDDAARYLAVAGALEEARTLADRPTPAPDTPDAGAAESVLPSVLLCLFTVSALDRVAVDDLTRPSNPPVAGQRANDSFDRCLRRGALLAMERSDVAADRIAAAAGISRDELDALRNG